MAYNLQLRIHFIIGLAGLAILCSGIVLFVSSYLVEDLMKGDMVDWQLGKNHCEYWAAIPTILTGIILLLSVNKRLKRYHELLSYLRICGTLIVMILALGVMVEEAADNGWSHMLVDGEYCENVGDDVGDDIDHHDDSYREHKETCEALRKADKMFYIMLFTADIVLVLSIIVLFAMFAEWMLFSALKTSQNGEHSSQMGERYERFSTRDDQGEAQTWEGQSGDKVPLQPV